METVVPIAAAPLTEAPYGDTQESLDGDPRMRELSLATYADGRVEVGIWEITPGRNLPFLQAGDRTIWTIWTMHETLRKVFVVASPL